MRRPRACGQFEFQEHGQIGSFNTGVFRSRTNVETRARVVRAASNYVREPDPKLALNALIELLDENGLIGKKEILQRLKQLRHRPN